MRLLSLFSGIGAYERALTNLGISYDLIGYAEIDPVASQAYQLLHNVQKSKNLGDIAAIKPESIPDFDLLTFSPPCQDISSIGKRAGITSETRTGLMFDVLPLIQAKRPATIVMENVPALGTTYSESLFDFSKSLRALGYFCTSKIFVATRFGVPQERKRLILVGKLRERVSLPLGKPLSATLADYLQRGFESKTCRTVRTSGRRSKIGDRHNWDAYLVDGSKHYLTACECLRLMGFSNDDYRTLSEAKLSDTSIYRLAGNTVVVPILEAIFTTLFGDQLAACLALGSPTLPCEDGLRVKAGAT